MRVCRSWSFQYTPGPTGNRFIRYPPGNFLRPYLFSWGTVACPPACPFWGGNLNIGGGNLNIGEETSTLVGWVGGWVRGTLRFPHDSFASPKILRNPTLSIRSTRFGCSNLLVSLVWQSFSNGWTAWLQQRLGNIRKSWELKGPPPPMPPPPPKK